MGLVEEVERLKGLLEEERKKRGKEERKRIEGETQLMAN